MTSVSHSDGQVVEKLSYKLGASFAERRRLRLGHVAQSGQLCGISRDGGARRSWLRVSYQDRARRDCRRSRSPRNRTVRVRCARWPGGQDRSS